MTNTFNIQVYLGKGFLSSVTTSYGQRCSMVQCFGCSDGVILSKESWSWCHCLSNRVFASNICRVCRGHAISSTTPERLVRCHGRNFSSTRKLHVDLCKWKHDLSNHLESWQVKRNFGLEKGHAFSRQSDMKRIDVNRVLGATGLCHIVAGHLKSRSHGSYVGTIWHILQLNLKPYSVHDTAPHWIIEHSQKGHGSQASACHATDTHDTPLVI